MISSMIFTKTKNKPNQRTITRYQRLICHENPIFSLSFVQLSFLLVPFAQADSSFAASMKERLTEVIKAKGEGTIGEGIDGLLRVR